MSLPRGTRGEAPWWACGGGGSAGWDGSRCAVFPRLANRLYPTAAAPSGAAPSAVAVVQLLLAPPFPADPGTTSQGSSLPFSLSTRLRQLDPMSQPGAPGICSISTPGRPASNGARPSCAGSTAQGGEGRSECSLDSHRVQTDLLLCCGLWQLAGSIDNCGTVGFGCRYRRDEAPHTQHDGEPRQRRQERLPAPHHRQ